MKCQHCNNYDIPSPYHVPGATMTVPGLAPTLIELIEANVVGGQPFPLTSQPLYDETEEAGVVRASSRNAVLSDVANFAHEMEQSTADVNKVQPEQNKPAKNERSEADNGETVQE